MLVLIIHVNIMKKLVLLTLSVSLLACNSSAQNTANDSQDHQTQPQPQITAEPNTMTINVLINHQAFTLTLFDNPTAQAFTKLLPLNLTMQDHLANEKFANLPHALPTDDKRAGQIQAGDIMLWQGDTVVIFYENFNSNYHYTQIGKIQNADTLKSAMGAGTVLVSFTNQVGR